MSIFGNIFSRFGEKNKIDAELFDASTKLKNFLQNQIQTLDLEGDRIFFNEITIGYVSHLLMMITKKPVSVSTVRHVLKSIFTDNASLVMMENALQIFSSDVEIKEKLSAIHPIAKKEFEAGSGDFLVRHTRKVRKTINEMFLPNPKFDPSSESSWSAKDLA